MIAPSFSDARAADLRREAERAPAADPARRRASTRSTSSASAAACSCSRPIRRTCSSHELKRGHASAADAAANARPDVRLARREIRQVQCDRVLRRRHDPRRRRRPDEPRRFGAHRQIKAQNAGLSLAGSAVASDAFFPFRDGLDVVVERRRDLRDPAGRLDARRRSDRRRRRAQRRDGAHRHAALPALSGDFKRARQSRARRPWSRVRFPAETAVSDITTPTSFRRPPLHANPRHRPGPAHDRLRRHRQDRPQLTYVTRGIIKTADADLPLAPEHDLRRHLRRWSGNTAPISRRSKKYSSTSIRNPRCCSARHAAPRSADSWPAALPVAEYTALQVKQAVVGYGRATKEQVQQMVARLLNLTRRARAPTPPTRSAMAICHAHSGGWR